MKIGQNEIIIYLILFVLFSFHISFCHFIICIHLRDILLSTTINFFLIPHWSNLPFIYFDEHFWNVKVLSFTFHFNLMAYDHHKMFFFMMQRKKMNKIFFISLGIFRPSIVQLRRPLFDLYLFYSCRMCGRRKIKAELVNKDE